MCEVTTALMGVSMALGAFGQIQQGRAQSAAASYQAAQDQRNAAVAERQAQDAEHRGKIAERNQRSETAQLIAKQRAGLGASGLDMNSGSSLDIQADAAMMGELDALTVRNNFEREAWGYRQQAQNFQNSAAMASSTAKNAGTAGMIGAGASLLGGAAQFSNAWGGTGSSASGSGNWVSDTFDWAKGGMPKSNTVKNSSKSTGLF